MVLTFLAPSQEAAARLFAALWEYLQQFEVRLTRFAASSELSTLNRQAGSWVNISPELRDFLAACQAYQAHSAGLCDPFVLPALQRAGYRGSWPTPEVFDPALDVSHRHHTAPARIELRAGQARIPLNTALDSGALGKGYALDRLAELAAQREVTNFWFSLGGDIICRGFDLGEQPWRIEIAAARGPGTAATVVNRSSRLLGIATSGTTKRRGEHWHHIIDPRTGQPSTSPILTATALAHSATAADCYATALVIEPGFEPSASAPALLAQALQTATGMQSKHLEAYA